MSEQSSAFEIQNLKYDLERCRCWAAYLEAVVVRFRVVEMKVQYELKHSQVPEDPGGPSWLDALRWVTELMEAEE